MITSRFVPFLMVFAILVCVVLMGVPWGVTPPFANFSGRVIYASNDGSFDLDGSFNLYGCEELPPNIRLKILIAGNEKEIELDRKRGTFSGCFDLDQCTSPALEAFLEVDGRVVAKGLITLPPQDSPGIHIIHFTSLS